MATTLTAPLAAVTTDAEEINVPAVETVTAEDLVFTDDDRARMRTELSAIPAVQALLAATHAA